MIKLLKILRKCLPNRFKSTGVKETIADFFHPKLSKLIGALERTKEVILFIPVIYKCVRWDHSSIYYILRHWLGRMEDVQRNDPYHVDANKHANDIKFCTDVLDRIIADNYHENVYGPHDEKWGKTSYSFEPTEDKEYSKLISTRKNARTEKEKEQERKEYVALMHKVTYLENQDIDFFFDTLKKKHRHWWT